MARFVHIAGIAEVYEFLGSGKPAHPQITVIRAWPQTDQDISQIKFTSDLYYMAMKSQQEGAIPYGRSSYDYQDGTMIFIGPGQVASFSGPHNAPDDSGWTILFHPDLVRKTPLAQTLVNYSFFRYDIDEALHLEKRERDFLNAVVAKVDQEIHEDLDEHSAGIVAHHLETIFKYCDRYYSRQFRTRVKANKSHVARFEAYLKCRRSAAARRR